MVDINYWAVLVCAVVAMVIGAIWYGPLFGKKWMEIYGATNMDIEARKKMQKEAGPLYLVQFLLTVFQVFVLAYFVAGWQERGALDQAIWIWAGFVMPTVAGAAMWNNDKAKVKWAKFLIQSGYQLVIFAVFGLILAYWK